MKHGILYLSALIGALVMCASCYHHDEPPLPHYNRVAVVYMMAENSLNSFVTYDLNEIRSAVNSIPDSCLLVVYLDDSRTANPQIITFEKEKGEQVIQEFANDPISTDSATMLQVLSIIKQRCPADSYGLILWSHGSGWIPSEGTARKTIGVDNGRNTTSNYGTEMEIPTLANVLKQTGITWEFIFFDACFMQGIEVAYELRDVARWCIGSPAEIPANGAPYHEIMEDFFRPTNEVWRIAEDYYKAYTTGTGVVISAVKTDQLDRLAAVTAPLISSLSEYPTTDIQQYLTTSSGDRWKPEYFDMGSAMHQWFSEGTYNAWREALERAVPHHYATSYWLSEWAPSYHPYLDVTDPEHVACLSMYIPIEGRKLNEYFTQCSWYRVGGWHQQW